MIEKALRQAALALVVLSATALALSTGIVGSTFALFNAETQNANSTFAGGWIDPPSAWTAAPSGYNVSHAWTPGTHGPVTGQKLYGVDNTTSSNCTGAAYTLLATLATASTAAYSDTTSGSAATNGHWFCYQLVSTSATAWTAQASQAIQLGLVTSGIAIANVGTNNSSNGGDTITLTFNQKTNLAASGAAKVCVFAAGKIIIGDTAGGNTCSSGDGYTVGTITGVTIGSDQLFRNSTFVTSTTAPWTMTVTLVGNTPATYSGTATFTPSATILSAATTRQATMCIAAAVTCQPTTATHF